MHMYERICKAEKELTPFHTEYCVVYEDIDMDCCAVYHPGPEAMAALMHGGCLLYTSPSPRDGLLSRMPSSA